MSSPFKHPKTGIYWFRRAVPKDLRDRLGRCELTKTLRTKDPAEAKRLFTAELEKSERLFQSARSGVTLSQQDIRALAGKWLAQSIEQDRSRPIGRDLEEVFDEGGDPVLDHLERAHERGEMAAVVGQDVDALLLAEGLVLSKDSPDYRALLEQVFWARVKFRHSENARAAGDWSKDKEVLAQYPDTSPALPLAGLPKPAPPSSKGDTLPTIFKAWADERKPLPKTLAEFSRPIRRFTELYGEVPASSITKPMVRAFKDALLKLPASTTWKVRDMPFPRLLAHVSSHPPDRTVSAGSVNKDLGCLAAVLSWAAKQGHFDALPHWSNPANDLKVQARKSPEEKRLSYDLEDLRLLFASPVFTRGARPKAGSGEAAKWLPILALFTGARLNELGQLLASDIRQEAGVWFLDINTLDEGKHVKTASSRRKVPLHSELLRLGFLAYVDGIRAAGGGPIFPDLRPDQHGHLTGNWSKWWGRYSRELGITDRRKVFHSFRHTFKTACRAAGIGKEFGDALTGHSSGDVGDDYGEKYPVAVLARELDKVRFEGVELLPTTY